jgi:predicted RNase H-like nuclease (RuvC/YqgF family)
VSKPEDKATQATQEAQAFDRLETVVKAAVTQLQDLRFRLFQAEEEGRELKELLRKFTEGTEDPMQLLTRVQNLESENEELLKRLRRGKEGVERLLARIRFLEEQG